jgi:hypothetical protein
MLKSIDPYKLGTVQFTDVYDVILRTAERSAKKIDYFRSRFYWQNDPHKRKYRLVKWEIMCQPKD